ncbi:MAG: histidinol-phosphate transaminase [Chloroflexi bacterium]|nr:histidinol-phosphate transaminase [Chloroflexota bacterium]
MTGPRLNPNLLKVPLYIGGKSIEAVKEAFGLDEAIKLASNESPAGPSPLATKAAEALLSQVHRYPGIVEQNLRQKIAARFGPELNAENIIIGNGGTDVLRMITQAFVFDGGNTIMCRATFPMYHILTTTFSGEVRQVDLTSDFRHDLQAMAETVDDDTRLIFLCSPNNPTGNIITQAEADQFLNALPDHVVVVFDESYYGYVTAPDYADSLAYVKAGRNVIVMHSFSKTAGLANLRVGYMIGPVELMNYVRHVQLPFHTSDVALTAAAASMDDRAYHARNCQAVLAGRDYLYANLCQSGLFCLPSQASFVTIVDPPMEAKALEETLLRRGFIVRAMGAFGMPTSVRVSVGTPEENEKFVSVLREVIGHKTLIATEESA